MNASDKHIGEERSPHWPKIEKEHLAMEPYCMACGADMSKDIKVQVHHVYPFHYCIALGRPDLELDHRNLVTLCEHEANAPAPNHHLLIGHLGNFKEGNLDVRNDASTKYFKLLEEQIKEDADWSNEVKGGRLKDLNLMTQEEKDNLRAMMDKNIPLIVK